MKDDKLDWRYKTPSSVTVGLTATCGLFDLVHRAARAELPRDCGVQQASQSRHLTVSGLQAARAAAPHSQNEKTRRRETELTAGVLEKKIKNTQKVRMLCGQTKQDNANFRRNPLLQNHEKYKNK